jgi:predicted transcriptional regulator
MIKLTEKRQGIVLWILENKSKQWSIHELCVKFGGLTYSTTHAFINQLLKAEYLVKTETNEFAVVNTYALIEQLSYTFPLKAKEKKCFFLKGSMFEKMKLVKSIELDHSFTGFAAGEVLHPYVKTERVHAYVRKADLEKWAKELAKKGARPAFEDEASLFLLPVEENYYFNLSKKIHNFNIAPIGLVLADLISIGGLGKEQAKIIEEGIK